MTLYALQAALLAAVSLVSVPLSAQAPAPSPSLERARQYLAEDRIADARLTLLKLPASAGRTRLRADIGLASGDLSEALEAYEELSARFQTPAPEILTAIATARASALRLDPDTRVRVGACEALLASAAHAECTAELSRLANDGTVDSGTRLAAARVLFERQTPGADRVVDLVLSAALNNSPASAAEALAALPPAMSNEPLKRLASSDNRDARYVATLALARRRTPDMIPVLRATASDREAGAARLVAHIGLAAAKDPEGIRILRETLPLIKGRERLEAALALTAIGDPQGPAMAEEELRGEHEMVRIEAAEALYPTRRELAMQVLTAGASSTNPWIRARAFRAFVNLGLPTTGAVRRSMLDRNAWVAVAATHAALADARRR